MVEDAVCHAWEQLSSGETGCWEVVLSQRGSSTSYGALRLLDLAYWRGPEREVKHR
jgi:hypothetical protein